MYKKGEPHLRKPHMSSMPVWREQEGWRGQTTGHDQDSKSSELETDEVSSWLRQKGRAGHESERERETIT